MVNKKEKQKPDCPGYYEVSGYTTKDGKKVDDYIRRCWKHGGGNFVTNFMGEMPNPTDDFIQTSDSYPQTTSNEKTEEGEIWDSIWKAVLQSYLNNLNKSNVDNRTYNNYSMAKYPVNNYEPKDLPVNFSTFDIKKTEENIKKSMGELGKILKQKEISNKDTDLIRANMKNIAGDICNDLENLVNRKSQLPDSPTVESARIADEIEKDKEITRDNIYNAVIMTNQARNAIEKSFENVDTNSPDYYDKLNDHAKKLDEIDKIGKSLRNLSENTLSIRSNIIDLANKIREDLGLSSSNVITSNKGVPTGFATSITEEKRKYRTDDPIGQRVFKIIEDIDSKIDNLNKELNELNNVKISVTKSQVLQKLETLKTLLEDTKEYYPRAEKIDEYNKKGINYKKDELEYWFDRVIKKLPRAINNTNRLVEKYAYYNPDKIKNINKLREDINETEKLLPENIKSKISLFTKILEKIIYLINRIIDNINFKKNPKLDEIEDIDPRYGKKPKMSEENEAIYDYALEHPYDPEDINELKKFLMRDDIEGYREKAYLDINGIWTIGYGDTHGVKKGMTTTKEKAEEKLEKNIKLASEPIVNYLQIASKNSGFPIYLTQQQFDALVSMAFNAGPGIVNRKIIVPYLSKGDYINAAKQIPYLTSDSNIGGLSIRRKLEIEYFWKNLYFIINHTR